MIGLEIKTTTIIAKIRQKQLKSAIASKNKLTSIILIIPIKDVEYRKYYKKWHF